MSIQDQVEAAWDRRCGESITHPPGAKWIYREGYLDALRSLFVEVKPEDAKHRENYWCLTSSGWKVLKWLSGMEWWDCRSETAYRVSDVSMIMDRNSPPSPSDLFTEGRA